MPLFRLLLLVVALACAVLVAACDDDEGGSNGEALDVEIGVVQSLSGAAGIYGKSVAQGIDLAVSEINGADDGVAVTVMVIEDESSVDKGKAAFETLIGRGVTAVIGPTLSNVALEAMPLAQAASVPVLGATNTAQGITEIGDYVFRVALTEAVVVPAAIARAHEVSPISTAALIFDGSDAFSRSSADAMRKGIASIAGTVVADVDVSQRDIVPALGDLQGVAPDAFLVTPLVNQSTEIVQAIRAAGFQQVLIGGNSFNTLAIGGAAGDAVEGAYVGAAWNPAVDNDVSRRFVAAYTSKYGEAPDLFAAQGYSSVYLLLNAVKRAGSVEHAAVRDALAATSGIQTPLGDLTMSDRREAIHDPVVQRFEDGKLVVLP